MRTIPCRQTRYAMHRGEGYVQRVRPCFFRKYFCGKKKLMKRNDSVGGEEYGQSIHKIHTPPRRVRVSGLNFLKHKIGNIKRIFCPVLLPPPPRQFLFGAFDGIPARPRRQVADDRGFEVYFLLRHPPFTPAAPRGRRGAGSRTGPFPACGRTPRQCSAPVRRIARATPPHPGTPPRS